MKVIFGQTIKKPAFVCALLLFMSFIFSSAIIGQTAQPRQMQLSLADILIGLRSKKATLAERNTILAEAIKKRGITFSLTPEIEKELAGTGASAELIEAARQKSPRITAISVAAPTPSQTPVPSPVPTPAAMPSPSPTPPVLDFAFYQKRAAAHLSAKQFDLAVVEYSKAIELNAKDPQTFLNRGLALINQKNYDLAVADFDKAIELNPKESMTYFNRGDLHEKMGSVEKALSDYQKAFELDANNEPAKANMERLQAEISKKPANEPDKASINASETSAAKQILNVGALNNLAVYLAIPEYTTIDRQRNLQGLVTVQITLDEDGKVISVKAISGHLSLRPASEAAALKSRFKPAFVGNQAVKATGFINYNFKVN
ncbi:MAG TPA: tetratricopeptide repeat protein [Pyrinomonadaceae bacterium]|jgi:TonB family protein